MSLREGLLVLLAVAAALVAALGFRLASHPEETTDPDLAARFARAQALLPVLGAVRLRTSRPRAADLLEARAAGAFRRIYDPRRAQAVFRYGRLLYAPKEQVARTLAMLKQDRLPPPPPPAPDLSDYFRDQKGPYTCDVLLAEPASLDRIHALLPEARLSGEPVARAQEARALSGLPRALLALAVVAFFFALRRRGLEEALRRLLALLVPLALLAVTGRGVDLWSLAALGVVVGAEQGGLLLCAFPGLFFPVPSLQRAGIVLVSGGIVRLRLRPRREPQGRRRGLAVLGGLALAGWAGMRLLPLAVSLPPAVRREPAVLFVPPDKVAPAAAALRAEGLVDLAGDQTLLPPRADRATRRMLGDIFQLASRRARKAAPERRRRFEELAEAAAVQDLYLRSDVRARLRTGDGRAVLWVYDAVLPEREALVGAGLYRLRATLAARKQGRRATLAIFLLAGILVWHRRGERAGLLLGLRFCGIAAGMALISLSGGAAGLFGPALAAAAFAPGLAIPLAVGAAGLFAPGAYLGPAAALYVATLAGSLFSRR